MGNTKLFVPRKNELLAEQYRPSTWILDDPR